MLRVSGHSERTDVGRQRQANEDSYLARSPLFVVADGMGGAQAGEVASLTAIQAFQAGLPDGSPEESIERTIAVANHNIYEQAHADASLAGMGTTITVAAVDADTEQVYIGHVGDSRVYRVRKGQIQMMTEDHSLRNDWLRMKGLSGEDVVNFPFTNVVVRALGLAEQVNVDVVIDEYKYDDIFLLCSDGLNDMIDDATILKVINKYERLDSCSSKLIAAANDAGGKDNITALLVRIERVS